MGLRVSFELGEDDLRHFRLIMREARKAAANASPEDIVAAAEALLTDVGTSGIPTFIAERLEKLENIADSFSGVSKSFALQAGREIRILVESEKVDDEEAVWLSKDIARRIEKEVQYPGEIKVTVIRETRAVDFAR